MAWHLASDSYQACGPFRTNVEEFVGFFGTEVDLKQSNVKAWSIEVLDADVEEPPTTLLVCQEDAAQEPPVCDQCRIIGEQIIHH